MREENLPSQMNEIGEKTYFNTLQALRDAQLGADKL
jgi:hypothetical protein